MGKLEPAYLGSSSGRRLCLAPMPHGGQGVRFLKVGKRFRE